MEGRACKQAEGMKMQDLAKNNEQEDLERAGRRE